MKTASPDPSKIDSGYELKGDGCFAIRDYNRKKPFSNFLPGIAGLYGTPMWAFYVNRGQGIVSFGTKNKDNAMLEFYPANKSYQIATSLGFRTFVKRVGAGALQAFEPFRESLFSTSDQTLEVLSHEFSVREVNRQAGLEIEARYFTLPGEPIAALVRELSVKNISSSEQRLEILDGLPVVNPFGMNEFFMKQMSRTIEAWMITENLARRAPFFRLRVDATDRPEVEIIHEGNFFFSVSGERSSGLLPPVVDPEKIFGTMLDFSQPKTFYKATPFRAPAEVSFENRTPSAFVFADWKIAPGRTRRLRSFYGHAPSVEALNKFVSRARSAGYFEDKRQENRLLIEGVKGKLFTVTASPAYDLYCGQTFLDNVLRGGLPVKPAGPKGPVLHVYSRKHGDLERDYNRFLVEPAYFAQGDGNYRDVNQNRRNDTWFEPAVGDTNIRTFLNLIQLDGFNPLIIKGTSLRVKNLKVAKKIAVRHLGARYAKACVHRLSKPFTAGELCRALEESGATTKTEFAKFFADLAPVLEREEKAEHGEGFWTDHWTYNLDLIESYFAIFPENERRLLFEDIAYTFHDSDHMVRPRSEKYFVKKDGTVRQYQAVVHDKEKTKLIASRVSEASAARARNGRGTVYRTALFTKLLCLFANKFASLDAEGVGVEMEADKPSWYDALNGLPGLHGSSLPETFELKRLVLFMIHALEDAGLLAGPVAVPAELYTLIKKTENALRRHFSQAMDDLRFWDEVTSAKEKYRQETASGVSGREVRVPRAQLKAFLEHAREKIEIGLEKAFDPKTRLYPTYFENEVSAHRLEKSGGAAHVRVTRFRQKPMPIFLEAAVHALKVEKDPQRKKELLAAVRRSALYDAKLGMYKVNAPMESASLEVGRARVFKPGWLENESVWLHMEYKFLLEVLKSGMPEEFFKDFRRALVPFQPPARYGRSVLENSSFIVSSVFSDASLHGAGFVARLSGSTAEFLHMWLLMNAGKKPFFLGPDGKVSLRFEPSLPASFFTEADTTRILVTPEGREEKVRVPKDCVVFLFLGKTLVFYHNPKQLDTFGKIRCAVKKITVTDRRGRKTSYRGDTLQGQIALEVRDGFVPRLDLELG